MKKIKKTKKNKTPVNIIDKIIKYNKDNDKNNKKISDILSSDKKYIISFYKSGQNSNIGIFLDNKLLFGGTYNFYGIYQPKNNLWIWATSIPGIEKKHLKNINKMKTFNYLFENENDEKSNFYYQLLTQDVLVISNPKTMLQWINDLIIYLSNDLYYINPINNISNIQFLTIVDIKEMHI
jgi:hypothetical protein